ncbi:MAG: glycoside hydrolase family 25 protein [Clostridiaceae bacterium]
MQNKSPNARFGIDINEYTQNVNFQVLARTIDFLYLRSSGSGTGRFRVDKKFLEHARQAREFGIPVGAYHYAIPSADLTTADAQADAFAQLLQQGFGERNYGDLFPVVDVEAPVNKSISTTTLVNWVDRFRRRFEQRTGRRLMLYTGLFFIQLYDNFRVPGKGYPLSDMPLWIAMYREIPGNPPYPPDAGGWTRWRIWQYTEEGRINGVDPPTDLNWGPTNLDLLRPPRRVTGLRAGISGGNINMAWNRNPDVDLNGYNIFLNGNYVKTVGKNTTSTVIPIGKYLNLIPKGSPYIVSMSAFDTDRESGPRATVSLARGDDDEDSARSLKGMVRASKIGESVIVPTWNGIKKIIK